MQKTLFIFCVLLTHSYYLCSNGPPPENPPRQPPVVTPQVPKETPPTRYNPGHR